MRNEFKTPSDMPLFAMLAAGKSPEAKLELIRHILWDLCKHISEQGYDIGEMDDAPKAYFEGESEGPATASTLLRHMLSVTMAEEITEKGGIQVPSQAGEDHLSPARN